MYQFFNNKNHHTPHEHKPGKTIHKPGETIHKPGETILKTIPKQQANTFKFLKSY